MTPSTPRSMREKIARAAAGKSELLGDDIWEALLPYVDAILKALTEQLTEGVLEHVRESGVDLGGYDAGGGDGDCHQCDPGDVFTAVITAIREGK